MRIKSDNHSNITDYIDAIFRSQGRDFSKCELCGGSTNDKPEIHHLRYEGATLANLRITCHRCNTQEENRHLA